MKDWLLGILLGLIGVVMVSGAMTGWYGPPVEVALWTLVGVGWVVAAHLWVEVRPWLAVIVAGVASGVVAGAMQAAFLQVLVERNDAWAGYTVNGATRFEAFYSALPIGIAWGLLFGGVTWLVGYLSARRRAANKPQR